MERAPMALILLCAVLLDSLVSPLGQPGTCGSGFLPKSALWVHEHPSCGWLPSHAVPLLPGHQPLFFRSCSYRGLDTKPQPFSPFPHAKPAGALGQCTSPSWTHRPHRATWGTSNLPGHLRHLKPARLYHQLLVLTGAGRVCLPVPKRWSKWGPTQLQQLYTKELHPSLGWAQTSIGVPHNFPSSSSWRVQDPEHLQEQPKCSPPFLLTPSPGGSVPPCRGIASSRSLCFPFRTAWRALGVQPHPGSSSEEGAGVPGWHQGTLAPLPRCPRRCLCEHGQPLSFLLLSSG